MKSTPFSRQYEILMSVSDNTLNIWYGYVSHEVYTQIPTIAQLARFDIEQELLRRELVQDLEDEDLTDEELP